MATERLFKSLYVRPHRLEALPAPRAAAPAISDTPRAAAMPGETHEERAIMAEIRRPALLPRALSQGPGVLD